jgi:large subunit ribosomal protein L16
MLRQPQRTPYRKLSKGGQVKGRGNSHLVHGMRGLYTLENARVTARQREASRRSIRHALARQGTLWIRVFPNRPVTAKPEEVRMGGGTGSVKYWARVMKKGTMRFELDYPTYRRDPQLGISALKAGSIKLPMATAILTRTLPLR